MDEQNSATHYVAQMPSKPIRRLSAQQWSLDSLTHNAAWQADDYWISERAKHHLYSFRMLRYWYMERLMAHARHTMGRPLSVLEVGVDRGQMKAFIDGVPKACLSAHPLYSRWDAADICPQREKLNASGYDDCHALNLDDTHSLTKFSTARRTQYDVIIVLHVLEHLTEPERALTLLSPALLKGGIVIGGFPVIPHMFAALREKQIRKSAQSHGHVSAFSPKRVQLMAHDAGLTLDYASGAFALRASGSPLEHCAWWLRLNTAFGALFPSWPGEIYWQMRRST